MSISFELPGLEESLRAEYGDLNEAAKEALLIDAYRTGRMSIGRLAEVLDRSVSGVTAWLNEHRVGPNYTGEDFAADRKAQETFRGKWPT